MKQLMMDNRNNEMMKTVKWFRIMVAVNTWVSSRIRI